ncbi:uncharacterized protein [Miscanthus floridulus]|uniref:uncharacterized protein isoform X2 n=1 Tax=Miscanthus floridulus TaxID=154761 RepID=UPI003459D240
MILWIRHVLMCEVQALSLDIGRFTIPGDPCLEVGNLPLVSQNLKRLKLESQQVNDSFLDFSRCPALEVLEFDDCEFLDCHRISSQSLKFLSFSNCDFDTEFCTYIYAPNLISLWLEVTEDWTPLLERMPSLVEAVVKIKFCDDSYCGRCGDEDCSSRYTVHGDSVDTVLLQGLSEAQSLVLMSDIRVCVFRRDLKCCPMFSNLKTLSLNEYWCMPDFSSLTCILEHSPILEKLTLQLFCKESKTEVEMKGSPDTMEKSNVISEHLKIVEVKCEVVDEKVLNVLKFLSKLSICSFRFQF